MLFAVITGFALWYFLYRYFNWTEGGYEIYLSTILFCSLEILAMTFIVIRLDWRDDEPPQQSPRQIECA